MNNIGISINTAADSPMQSTVSTPARPRTPPPAAGPSGEPSIPATPEFLRKMRQQGGTIRSMLQQQIAIETQTVETLKRSVTMSAEAKTLAEIANLVTPAHSDAVHKAERLYSDAQERLDRLLGKQNDVDSKDAAAMKSIDQQFAALESELLDQRFDEILDEMGEQDAPSTPEPPQSATSTVASTSVARPHLPSHPLQDQMRMSPAGIVEPGNEAEQSSRVDPVGSPAPQNQPTEAAPAIQTASSQNPSSRQASEDHLHREAQVAFEGIIEHLLESGLTDFVGSLEKVFGQPATREARMHAATKATSLAILDPGTEYGNARLRQLYTLRAFARHLPENRTLSTPAATENEQMSTALAGFPINSLRVRNPAEHKRLVYGTNAASFLYNFIAPRDAVVAQQFEERFFNAKDDPRARPDTLDMLARSIDQFRDLKLDTQGGRYTEERLRSRLALVRELVAWAPPNAVFPRPAPLVGAMTSQHDVIDADLSELVEAGSEALKGLYPFLKLQSASAALSVAQAFTTPTPPAIRQDILERVARYAAASPDLAIRSNIEQLKNCAMKFTQNNCLRFESEESKVRKRLAL